MAGVYIKNMEKPRKCIRCPLALWGHCAANNDKDIEKIVADALIDKDCPLIEVPERGRLIDADALICNEKVNTFGAVFAVAEMPTILQADKERK